MEEQPNGFDGRRNRAAGKHGERPLLERGGSGSNSGGSSGASSTTGSTSVGSSGGGNGSGGSTRSSGGAAGNVAPGAAGFGFPSLSKIFTSRYAPPHRTRVCARHTLTRHTTHVVDW